MEKYLVQIRIPALNQQIDVRVPHDLTFGEVAKLVSQMACILPECEEILPIGSCELLYRVDSGQAYHPETRVSESNLRSGDQLILM